MATYKGKDGVLKVGTQIVGELRTVEVTTTANEVDTSTMGSDWTGVDSTQNSWKVSAQMFYDPADAGQILVVAGTKLAIEFFPVGSGVGLTVESGTVLVTSVGRPQSHDNIIERNVEMTGDGPLASDTVVA